MSESERFILFNTELAADDRLLILLVIRIQNENGFVTQPDLAVALGWTLSKVYRRLRGLRDRDLLLVTKVSKYRWLYDVSPLLQNTPTGGQDSDSVEGSDESDPPKGTPSTQTLQAYIISEEDIALLNSNLVKPARPSTSPQSSQEPDMRQRERQSLLDEVRAEVRGKPPLKERFGVPRDTRRDRHEAKAELEYNAHDIQMVFQDSWKEMGLSSRPKRWTARDFKHAKDLIDEQGQVSTVKLIKYVLANWSDLVKRYGVRGYPQMGVIYGFRGSWVPEAVDGVQAEPSAQGAEFSGSDIQSGQWD